MICLTVFSLSLFLTIPPVPSYTPQGINWFPHVILPSLLFLISRIMLGTWRKISWVWAAVESVVFTLFAIALAFRFSI